MANFFPKSTNYLPLKLIVAFLVMVSCVAAGITYYFTPKYTRVGYMPSQPVPFSHEIHAGQLGMDCRYCHSFVEKSGHANVPTASTCWNCHQLIKPDSPNLAAVKDAALNDKPISWVKVHKVPDYAYFDHSVHVNSGISCRSCHGKINEMPVVYHHEPQSMSWCLDCHRNPERHLRPMDKVTDLNWDSLADAGKKQNEMGMKIKQNWHIEATDNCAACHR